MFIPPTHCRLTFVILATNGYLPLGIRFIRNFLHYHKASSGIVNFVLGTDNITIDPGKIAPNVTIVPMANNTWREGTNSKFRLINRAAYMMSSPNTGKINFMYYVDADTDVDKSTPIKAFLQWDLLGGEHFNNIPGAKLPFDHEKEYYSYVPEHYSGPYMYGAFFGGKLGAMADMSNWCGFAQEQDSLRGYEPGVNDESYINAYFANRNLLGDQARYFEKKSFPFVISHKGGLEQLRNPSIKNERLTQEALDLHGPFRISDGQIQTF